MTVDQEVHLKRIKDWICEKIDKKYRAGQKEHGGDLWKKPAVFDFLLEEVIDLVVYAKTLQDQRDDPSIIDQNAKDK